MKKFILILLIVLVDSAPLLDQASRNSSTQGLYSPEDNVEILNANNLKSSIHNSNRAWLVEFYNSWCGFCQRFAPSWKEFGADVKNWKDLIAIAVINCAEELNFPICGEFNITKYPTVKYYSKQSQGDGEEISPGVSAYDHRKSLIEIMKSDQINGTNTGFPNLLPYNGDVSSIFESQHNDIQIAFLIVQSESDTIGPELILDFHKLNAVIIKYANNDNTKVTSFLGVDAVPSVYVIERNNIDNPKYLTSYTSDRQGFISAISRVLQMKNISLPKDDSPKNEILNTISVGEDSQSNDAEIEEIKRMGDAVFQVDLENAFKYSLKREIGTQKSITGEKLQALRAYVDLLQQYFPFQGNGNMVIQQIKSYVYQSEDIDGTYINHLVKAAEDSQIFFSKTDWVGCKGSKPWYRGYPCGLWKLFHYLTVNAAVQQTDSNPRIVLETMHGYIKNFFGCTDCSSHFLEMAARREISKVSSWKESVLWLWRAHNEVNQRLSKDQTEDPKFPKVQFPAKDRCPNCYVSNNWNEDEVLKYLQNMYSSKNIKDYGNDRQVLNTHLKSGAPVGNYPYPINIWLLIISLSGYLTYLIY